MRCIVIDALKLEIREEQMPPGGHEQLIFMQKTVGGYIECAGTLQQWPTPGHGDVLFVDEDGWIRRDPVHGFFRVEGATEVLRGNGLITGIDGEGETIAARLTLEEVRSRIKFLRPAGYLAGRISWALA